MSNILKENVAQIWAIAMAEDEDIGVARDQYMANLAQEKAAYGDVAPEEDTCDKWNALTGVEKTEQANDFTAMVEHGDNYEILCVMFHEEDFEGMKVLAAYEL